MTEDIKLSFNKKEAEILLNSLNISKELDLLPESSHILTRLINKTYDVVKSLIDENIFNKAKIKQIEQKLKESEGNLEKLNEVFIKFKDDPLYNLQLLVDTAGTLLKADCAMLNLLKKVNGKEIIESVAIYKEPPGFIQESEAKGHICADIFKDNPEDVVILKNLDKSKYAKTDENVQKYNLKQYVSFIVRFNKIPIGTCCAVYKDNREISENDINILKIISQSASIEIARRNSQNKLRESEVKSRNTIANLDVGFYNVGMEGQIFAHNPSFSKILGFKSSEDLSGLNVTDFWQNPKLRKVYLDQIKKIGFVKNYIVQSKKQDGEVIVLQVNSHLIKDKSGKPLRIEGTIADISERYRLEQKLKESEERYRLLFDDSPYTIALLDMKGTIINCNSIVKKVFGFKREEIIGKNFLDLPVFPPEVFPLVKDKFKTFLKEGRLEPIEIQFYKKDHNLIWIQTQVSLVKLDNETLLQVIFHDITERKKVEEEIKKTHSELDQIFNSSIPLRVIDKNYNIIRINDTYSSFFNMNKDDVVGKKCYDISKGHHCNTPECSLKQLLDGRELYEYEINKELKDGTMVSYIMSSKPFLNVDGEIIGIIQNFTDITNRKKAEQKLKESEEKYRSILENMKDGYFEVDLQGNFTFVNNYICTYLGYSSDDLLGMNYSEILEVESMNEVFKTFNQVYNEVVPRDNFESQIVRNDGKKRNIEGTVYLKYDSKGNKVGFFGFTQDITERKRAEITLIESESHYKNFISIASHEFKTPLIPIIGIPQLLLKDNTLSRKQKEFINEIYFSGKKINKLIDDLLDTSKIDTKKIQLKKQKVKINHLINQCVTDLDFLIKRRKLAFELNFLDDITLTIDITRISQVITNLISNAIKYTPQNGKIEISTQLDKDDNFIFSIKDNGIGIDEKYKELVFQKFGKIRDEDFSKYELESYGSGLGLFISKEIIKLHSGEIWFESEGKNKGTTFYFKLPL